MRYSLTLVSRNQKLGPMPAATSARTTCPSSCPLKGAGGCYAEYGPMSLFWGKVDRGEAGSDFDGFVKEVERLPRRQIWRYGQAGDLPGEGDLIDREQMLRLAKANRGRPVIAFTHKPTTEENLETLLAARELGFSVNLSANDVDHADELAKTGLNVVVVLPTEYEKLSSETMTEYRARLNTLPRRTPAGAEDSCLPSDVYGDYMLPLRRMREHREAIGHHWVPSPRDQEAAGINDGSTGRACASLLGRRTGECCT